MDSNEIEEEFNNTETKLSDLNVSEEDEVDEVKDEVEENEKTIYLEIVEDSNFWRTLLMVFMFFSGGLIFHRFFPIKFLTSENLWEKYVHNCCDYIYNRTRCSFNGNCSILLLEWIKKSNVTQNITETCCYWFAPYSKWRILSEAFCEIKCLN